MKATLLGPARDLNRLRAKAPEVRVQAHARGLMLTWPDGREALLVIDGCELGRLALEVLSESLKRSGAHELA